jgi:hypothetical protein
MATIYASGKCEMCGKTYTSPTVVDTELIKEPGLKLYPYIPSYCNGDSVPHPRAVIIGLHLVRGVNIHETVTTLRNLKAIYHAVMSTKCAIEVFDHIMSDNAQEPMLTIRRELDACQSLSSLGDWAANWLEKLT